jgi:hypothetical protein
LIASICSNRDILKKNKAQPRQWMHIIYDRKTLSRVMPTTDHRAWLAADPRSARAPPNEEKTMHWAVLNDRGHTEPWLTPFVRDTAQHFEIVGHAYGEGWHSWRTRRTPLREWGDRFHHARKGLAHAGNEGGLITQFPQLTAAAGMLKRLQHQNNPIVAYHFNLGSLYVGPARQAARYALSAVDRFIVHAQQERALYARWLKLPEARFTFVPLQLPWVAQPAPEDEDQPFILAMGSAQRDYPTLLAALERLKLPTVLVAAPRLLEGLTLPPHVEARSGLSRDQCEMLTQRARLCAITLRHSQTAAGQITLVNAMRFGRPVVATRCIGTEDYIDHGRTGMLVEGASVAAWQHHLAMLWHDHARRRRIAAMAHNFAREQLSDQAAGRHLQTILQAVAREDATTAQPGQTLAPTITSTAQEKASDPGPGRHKRDRRARSSNAG